MSATLRPATTTVEAFLEWAPTVEGRWELDSGRPVAMTGGTPRHSLIGVGLQRALDERLANGPCRVYGSDAAVATGQDTVRFPDSVVSCTAFPDTDPTVAEPVVAFEILSPNSGGTDRIVKLREYAAVASICRYVILEHATVGATAFHRAAAGDAWTGTPLAADEAIDIPELSIRFPLAVVYARTGLADAALRTDG